MSDTTAKRMSGAERMSDADRQAVWAALNAEVVRTFLAQDDGLLCRVERGSPAPSTRRGAWWEAPERPALGDDACDCAECRW